MEIVLVTIILGATVILAFFITKVFKSKQKDIEVTEEPLVEENENDKKSKSNSQDSNEKQKKKFNEKKMKEKVVQFSHPWLLSTLKGHSGRVLGKKKIIKNLFDNHTTAKIYVNVFLSSKTINSNNKMLH